MVLDEEAASTEVRTIICAVRRGASPQTYGTSWLTLPVKTGNTQWPSIASIHPLRISNLPACLGILFSEGASQ